MSTNFQEAFTRVTKLVTDFDAKRDYHMAPTYKEAQARKDFIDKFWIALGWDVNHDTQTNPYEQEVRVEVPGEGEAIGRSADYAFYTAPNFREVRFFVEAKKPSVTLKTADNYFQTLRYGWSGGPLSVLTDFEEFHILDCRFKPDIDSALNGWSKTYHYSDYAQREKFAEIFYLFGREAVLDGSLETFAVENLPKRSGGKQRGLFHGGSQSLDEDFLNTLDDFRLALARSFKNKNQQLDAEALTEATQRVLDRLVFMRFLEDKLIEPERLIANFGKRGNHWQDFVAQSRRLDRIYNGIVFKQHFVDGSDFEADNAVFGNICDELASNYSPYNFNTIPIHILGSIYERFLGKIIEVEGNEARLTPKPEVRKAGGVYYTPEYIVRYIVEKTVGPLLEGKTPEDLMTPVESLRIADIACGSGSFLLGVYDYLLNSCSAFYNNNGNRAHARKAGCIERDGLFHLSLFQRREVLLNNIYGVDIDAQAVEVAQMSLFLKLLETETTASARDHQRTLPGALLPSLDTNIVHGNSLIGTDILGSILFDLTEYELKKLRPIDFGKDAFRSVMREGGFDAIVGNPPYDVVEKQRGAASWPHTALSDYVKLTKDYEQALGGKLNLFRFFIIRGLKLVRNGGRIGMIVPLALLADISCARTRKSLMLQTEELEVDCFPQKDNPKKRVFLDAKLSTLIFNARKASSGREEMVTIRVYPGNSFRDSYRTNTINLQEVALLDPVNVPIPLVDADAWAVCTRIHTCSAVKRLGYVNDFSITRGEINQTIYRAFISSDINASRLLKGVEVGRFHLHDKLSQGEREWFNETAFLSSNNPKPVAFRARIATQRITGVDEKLRVVATFIEPPTYFADSTNSIVVSSGSHYSLYYLLGLLNSRLFQWRFKITSTNNNVGTNELESLPFRTIDFSQKEDNGNHNVMIRLVEQMTDVQGKLQQAVTDRDISYYKMRRDSLDLQIDTLVYELYGLTNEEIALVEAG